jgi:hypothetical protein
MLKNVSITSESTLVGLAVAVLVALGNWAQSGQPLTWTTLIAFLVPAVLNFATSSERQNETPAAPAVVPSNDKEGE